MSKTNSYKINPCKSCRKNYDITDINSINQCCYNTLGAFEGTTSINDFRNNPEAMNCQQCILDSMKSINRTPCDLRMTAYPDWIQAPHYFPKLLDEEGDVGKATEKCIELCKSNRYPNECMLNCQLDSDAVETVENYVYNTKKYGVEESSIKKLLSNDYVYITVVTICSIIFIFLTVWLLSLFEGGTKKKKL